MTLKALVESLRQTPEQVLQDAGKKFAAKRVVYPSDWERCETEISQVAYNEPLGYSLALNARLRTSAAAVSPLLSSLLTKARGMQFAPGTFSLDAKVCWSPDGFLQERNLGSLTQAKMKGSFGTWDATRGRIGSSQETHMLEAVVKAGRLSISARGDYSALLPQIIAEVKPQLATIRLSPADAERWLSKLKGWRRWMKWALRPQKRNYMSLQWGGGPSFHEKEEIEVTVAAAQLPSCADAVGKPLINAVNGEQSFVVSLTKVLHGMEHLSALQHTARITRSFRPAGVFGYPLLTPAQAKELLEKEINIVVRSYYDNEHLFGINTHTIRGPLVKRLAREHFGEDILAPFDAMDAPHYLAFLRERGYGYQPGQLKENEPPYILKEMYLLEFFRQSYANDSRSSIEEFRNWYVNDPPSLEVTGEAVGDASAVANLVLPSQSHLTGLSLEQRSSYCGNRMAIGSSYGDEFHFWLRVWFNSPQLLDLQEEACQKMGVVCF